jgi:iron complex outermembrane recepter protein
MIRLSSASLLLAGTAMLTAVPAWAQETDERPESEMEIVVTTKDHSNTIWNYPGSVTVIGSDALEARHFTTLSSLSHGAPNVSLDEIGTFKGVANFAIRGLGVNSSIPSIDPAVGLYVDGVYIGVNAGTVFDALDVSRVELIRGPQGVTFGRNTTGGAVLVSTANPERDEWKGSVRIGMEGPVDQGRGSPMATGRAVISGPLNDSFAVRFGALHTSDGGYFRNRFNGNHIGAFENTVLRGALAWDVTDELEITAKGEWNRSDGDGAPTHNNGQNPRDRFDLSVNEEGFHHSRSKFATLRAEYAAAQIWPQDPQRHRFLAADDLPFRHPDSAGTMVKRPLLHPQFRWVRSDSGRLPVPPVDRL